jgi:hypothetical protein
MDIEVFKNIFEIFLNESPIVNFSFLLQVLYRTVSKKHLPYEGMNATAQYTPSTGHDLDYYTI